MTISELHIQLDLQPENKIDILEDVATYCSKGYLFIDSSSDGHYSKGYLFIDSSDGHCYPFDENGNEDDIKKLTKIDNSFFYNSDIESIVIPDSVKSIGYSAFAYCESLKSIVIPDSVKSIGRCAFYGCKSLKSVIIPQSVEWIGEWTFESCKSLKSLAFKGKTINQVKAMKSYPFEIEDESIIRCV